MMHGIDIEIDSDIEKHPPFLSISFSFFVLFGNRQRILVRVK